MACETMSETYYYLLLTTTFVLQPVIDGQDSS